MADLQRKYNLKSPAVKRLMREAQELREPTEQYFAQPLEDNLFEWHFTVRGAPDTDFADGRYHGRITLPAEYPMKPPSIILLTPNGRFELGKKICLSMSAHHPETWQPSWSIRTVLLAIIGFMPTKGAGAIGALDYTASERKILATKSKDYKCEACEMDHRNCLLEVDPAHESSEINEAKELASQISFKGESEKSNRVNNTVPATSNSPQQPNEQQIQQPYPYLNNMYNNQHPGGGLVNSDQQPKNPTSESNNTENTDALRQRVNIPQTQEEQNSSAACTEQQGNTTPLRQQINVDHSRTDYVTLVLMWIITAIIVLLILRRLTMESTTKV